MTNHSKDSRSIDSGSSSTEETMASEIRIEQAREWMKTQPHCIRYHEDGSPSCDGADLVGYDHVPPCPLAGRADLSGRSTLTIPELLAAYALRLSEDTAQSSEARRGVEGAHEGTTADKKAELPREHQCVSANDCPLCDEYIPAGSREPERLNNAQKPDKEILNTLLFAYDDLHAKVLKDKGYPGCLLACPHCSLIEQATVALAESSLSQKLDALVAEHADDCKKCEGTGFEHILRTTAPCRWCQGTGKVASLSSPPHDACPVCGTLEYGCCPSVAVGDPWLCRKPQRRDFGEELADMVKAVPNFRQSPSPMNHGAESAHSGKLNTADKSGLLPTQLPKEK